MSGAIALVVYEAGVCHEIYRLLQAWKEHHSGPRGEPAASRAYKAVFQLCPIRPVVDILTGASAGGINSVCLASCIATGADFSAIHDLWIEAADIGTLQYPHVGRTKSLLDSQPLYDRIARVLQQNAARAAGDPNREPVDLAVRICRTRILAQCLRARDALGHEIEEESRGNVINFRTEAFQTTEPAQIDELTRTALATSAFPPVFPPIRGGDSWYIDGGLWDNQPIDLAVEVIRDKPAFLRTFRALVFVEPDPTVVGPKSPLATTGEPAMPDIIAGLLLMGLKGNIWPAVRDLMTFNQRTEIFDRLLTPSVLKALAEQPQPAGSRISVLNQLRVQRLLFDNDPFLNERWQALLSRLDSLALSVDDEGAEAAAGAPGESPRQYAERCALNALGMIGLYDLALEALRCRIVKLGDELKTCDTPESSRDALDKRARIAVEKALVYTRIEQINRYLFADEATGEADGDDVMATDQTHGLDGLANPSRFRRATLEMLAAIDDGLPKTPGALKRDAWTGAGGLRAAGARDALNTWVQTIEVGVRAGRLNANAGLFHDNAEVPTEGPIPRLEPLTWEDLITDRPRYRAIRSFQKQAMHERRGGVLQSSHGVYGDRDRSDVLLRTNDPPVDDTVIARYLLGSVSDLLDKRSIDLIRIAPTDTNNRNLISKRLQDLMEVGTDKLAGRGLGHLSGFFESRWRRNDYIWGRLDAAEVLLRTLQRYGGLASDAASRASGFTEDQYDAVLRQVQTEILKEEATMAQSSAPAGKGSGGFIPGMMHHRPARAIPSPERVGSVPRYEPAAGNITDAQTQEANDLLIGYGLETLGDADEPGLTNHLNDLLHATVQLFRGDSDKPPAALSAIERIFRLVTYPVQFLAFIFPLNATCRRLWSVSALILGLAVVAWAMGFDVGSNHSYTRHIAEGIAAVAGCLAAGSLLGWRWYWSWLIVGLIGVEARTWLPIGNWLVAPIVAIGPVAFNPVTLLIAGLILVLGAVQRLGPDRKPRRRQRR